MVYICYRRTCNDDVDAVIDLSLDALWQALAICHQTAKRQIERNAVRSLVALAAPDWSDDVVATAAALAAEMATVSCISSLLLQVSPQWSLQNVTI